MKIGVKDTKEKLSDYGGRRTNEMLSLWERNKNESIMFCLQ